MQTANISSVCILGGGPAGLAAAIALNQSGYRSTVVDHAIPPVDKACGEGLLPDSIDVLHRLGVRVPFDAGFRFRGVRFLDAQSSVAADFPKGMGVGVRRTVLHGLLLARANNLDVTCLWGAKNIQLTGTRVVVDGHPIEADFVVAADGQNSTARRISGLHNVTSERRRYAFRRHYKAAPSSPYMDLHWGPECQIYITPVAEDEICVVSMSSNPKVRLNDALTHFPALNERLAKTEASSRETGGLSVSRKLHRVWKDRVALIGDASGSVDAITGEGLCLSFKQALSLAGALRSGNLNGYQSEHDRLSRRPHAMGMLLLTLDRHPGLQRKALIGLARRPEIFSSLLAVHVGAGSVVDLFSWQLVDFCRALLAA